MFATQSQQLTDLLMRICGLLQITQTQHNAAEGHYNAIGEWLADSKSGLYRFRPAIYSQGSFRIGTTVKPREREEYDVDLVCELQVDPRLISSPVLLLDLIEARLRQHGDYKTRIERKNRCIRVVYARDFYLDILPGCPDPNGHGTCLVVPDREASCWKPSNPKGYAEWFESIAGKRMVKAALEPLPTFEYGEVKPPLSRVVQLVKRWRDVFFETRPDLAPISIVLTTLAGHHYVGQSDVSDGLTAFLEGVVRTIPSNGNRLVVLNPSNQKEDLSEKWDRNPRAYSAFVSGMASFLTSWRAVVAGRGIPEVAVALSALFGEELTGRAVDQQAEALQKARKNRELSFSTKSKSIVVGAGAGTIPVRTNTFFGE
jgi:hypothetical protein